MANFLTNGLEVFLDLTGRSNLAGRSNPDWETLQIAHYENVLRVSGGLATLAFAKDPEEARLEAKNFLYGMLPQTSEASETKIELTPQQKAAQRLLEEL